MKAVCISSGGTLRGYVIGRIYNYEKLKYHPHCKYRLQELIKYDDHYYERYLTDDSEFNKYFITLEQFRNEKIDKILI